MKICIVTGSTGALGQQVVSDLKNNNYYVVNIGRSSNANADSNIICDFNYFDITKLENELQTLLNNKEITRLDFVHCAGAYFKETDNATSNQSILLNSYNTNTFSFYNIVNTLVPFWKNIKNGSVVAISSNLTKLKNKNTAIYVSSKMALQGMIESFAQTYGNLNIRFNTICPGMFPSKLNSYTVPEKFKSNSPLGRICESEDISDLILFLLSDKSSCITAQNIIIDGGNSNGY